MLNGTQNIQLHNVGDGKLWINMNFGRFYMLSLAWIWRKYTDYYMAIHKHQCTLINIDFSCRNGDYMIAGVYGWPKFKPAPESGQFLRACSVSIHRTRNSSSEIDKYVSTVIAGPAFIRIQRGCSLLMALLPLSNAHITFIPRNSLQ